MDYYLIFEEKLIKKELINILLYQILTYTIQKNLTKTINLKYQPQRGMMNLSYLADHILSQIFKIILTIS